MGAHALASLGTVSLPVRMKRELTVSAPDDPHEREADSVADRVLRMPDGATGQPPLAFSSRSASATQRKCRECEEEEQVQRKESGHGPTVPAAVASAVQRAIRAPGQPLDPVSLDYFESRFGADFGQVRVHTDASAAQAARSLHARAFTIGSDIVFAHTQHAPGSHEGRRLLAHELTHVVQQGHAPAKPPGGATVIAPVPSSTLAMQRDPDSTPADDPALVEELQAERDAARADVNQDGDLMRRAFGARMDLLLTYYRPPRLRSQSDLDAFLDKLRGIAKTEMGTLTAEGNPFTPEFALEKYPKGFPLTWSGRVYDALSLHVNTVDIVADWKQALSALTDQSRMLGPEIYAHGLPVPYSERSRLAGFRLRLSDAKATNSSAIADYARQSIRYIQLKWISVFAFSWESFVNQLAEAVADGKVVVNYVDWKDFVDHKQAILRDLPARARDRIAGSEKEAQQLQTDAVKLGDAALAVGMASGLYSLAGILSGWTEASNLFDSALRSADKSVAADTGGRRMITALKWAWDNGYFGAAATEWVQNLIAQGPEILAEITTILILGLIPGVNIAVAIYLALTLARDVVSMIHELGASLSDCANATDVAQLQRASIRLAGVLTNGAILILVVLVTEGIGRAAARLRKEAAGLRAADRTLTEEAAQKKALERLPAEERKALEKGPAKLAKKFEEEVGSVCMLGSINCRVKLPDHIEKEAGPYPTDRGVPMPGGPFTVEKSALSGVSRSTEELRTIARANRKNWPDFDKALAAAERAGKDWVYDADGVAWEVHHVKPVFMGGTNASENLFPLPKRVHQKYTNWWNDVHRAFKKRFTETEWDEIYGSKRSIPGSKVPTTTK
jgi:Domain of unknown function (DUF4157)